LENKVTKYFESNNLVNYGGNETRDAALPMNEQPQQMRAFHENVAPMAHIWKMEMGDYLDGKVNVAFFNRYYFLLEQ
jgi:hypothetical protein